MSELRKIPMLIAIFLMLVAVLVEIGATSMVKGKAVDPAVIRARIQSSDSFAKATEDLSVGERSDYLDKLEESIKQEGKPPGLGIPYMALIDGILLFTVVLIALGFLLNENLLAKLQGIVTLVFSILLILGGLILVIIAFILLMVMVSLFFSPPFGTLAYLAIFGFFNTGGAEVVLALLMALKIGFVIALLIARPKFLQNKGLVLLVLTSFLANIVVTFLQGIVPFILVSITDAIAAIILGIVAIIWGIVLLIGAIISVVEALATT